LRPPTGDVGTIALEKGAGTMADFKYIDGAAVLRTLLCRIAALACERLRKKLKELGAQLSTLRTHGTLAMMDYSRRHLQGHIQYYGVSGNFGGVQRYLYIARRLLFRWLNRRSQRRSVTWKRFTAVIAPSLPRARVIHHLYPTPAWQSQTGSWMV